MRLLLLMSFSNLSLVSETSFENNNTESDVFAVLKIFIIKKINEFSINLSQSSDNQYILYSLKNSEKAEIFLT